MELSWTCIISLFLILLFLKPPWCVCAPIMFFGFWRPSCAERTRRHIGTCPSQDAVGSSRSCLEASLWFRHSMVMSSLLLLPLSIYQLQLSLWVSHSFWINKNMSGFPSSSSGAGQRTPAWGNLFFFSNNIPIWFVFSWLTLFPQMCTDGFFVSGFLDPTAASRHRFSVSVVPLGRKSALLQIISRF